MSTWASNSTNPAIIAVVGSLTRDIIFETDRIPKLGESVAGTGLSFKHAGKGANIAVAAHRASHVNPNADTTVLSERGSASSHGTDGEIRVYMNGAVGDDDVGPSLRDGLREQGIDVSGVQILPNEQTGHAAIILDTNSRQASQLGFKGANLLFRPHSKDVECLTGDSKAKPDVLIAHCTMDLGTVKHVMSMAHEVKVETILSLSPPVNLEKTVYSSASHVVLNEHEAAEISGRQVTDLTDLEVAKETAADFVGFGAKFAVVTLGDAGAVYATHDGRRGYVPAEKDVEVKDTTGAGDSFLGAYAVSLVRQRKSGDFDIEKAIFFASKAAARAIESIGAQTSLPWADQIEKD